MEPYLFLFEMYVYFLGFSIFCWFQVYNIMIWCLVYIVNLRYADDTTVMAESKEGTKESLDEGERGKWKSWLKTQHSKNEDHGIQSLHFMANRWGNCDRLFSGLQNHCGQGLQSWNLKTLPPWKKSYDKSRQCIKKQRHYFANKGLPSQSYGFSSSHVWLWELDHKESWVMKNRCFWTVVLEKTLESSLDSTENKPVHPKGNQSWIFAGGTDAEAEALILWPPDEKSQLLGKDPDAEKDWKQEEEEMTEDKMVGWYHWLNGHEFEQTLGDGEGQGSLACCIPWGCKETRLSNWTTIHCKIATLEWGWDKVVSVGRREPLFLHTKVPTHPFVKPFTTSPTRQEARFCLSVQRHALY